MKESKEARRKKDFNWNAAIARHASYVDVQYLVQPLLPKLRASLFCAYATCMTPSMLQFTTDAQCKYFISIAEDISLAEAEDHEKVDSFMDSKRYKELRSVVKTKFTTTKFDFLEGRDVDWKTARTKLSIDMGQCFTATQFWSAIGDGTFPADDAPAILKECTVTHQYMRYKSCTGRCRIRCCHTVQER